MFVASCRALFAATHPDGAEGIQDFAAKPAEDHRSIVTHAANAAIAAFAAYDAHATDGYPVTKAAADAIYYSASVNDKSLRQALLLALREDLFALHSNQTLAGRELWPKEAASLLDVNDWLSAFQKNLERYEMSPEILNIYKVLLEGTLERVILSYPPDLFDELFESTKSAYEEWKKENKPIPEQTVNVPRVTLHSELPSETDYLDQEPLAEVLSNWLKKNHLHTAIGLFGDWGLGKSTFVNLLRNHLNIPLNTETAEGKRQSGKKQKATRLRKRSEKIFGIPIFGCAPLCSRLSRKII